MTTDTQQTDQSQQTQQAASSRQESTAMTRFSGDKFLARKKVFSFLGEKFHIYGPNGQNLRFFVKQKAFKLKEAIKVYADESCTTPLLEIKARQIIDVSATYDVMTAEGQHVGALQRKGMKSFLRDEWAILDSEDNQIGKIEEDSLAAALVRRFMFALLPQTFNVVIDGEKVAEYSQHFNPFIHKFDLDFSLDTDDRFDRRLGIASVVLLLAIEGRQS
ncbi:MAG: hypothetical protein ACOCV2_07170 [Persicimonas sp.]